jgi:3-hydroxybutyryl-CoA dehydrogenase
MAIQIIGVVGMGQMGGGIIEACARAGFTVIGREINDELVARGLNNIKKSFSKGMERGKLSQAEVDTAWGKITGTTALADFAHCDLVIEAATENMQLKKTLFTELDVIVKPEAILASNTSSLSITEIASATQRADRVVGLHFFNPVPVMPLIEIVRGLLTSEETIETVRVLGEKLNKTLVFAKDNPGFIVNLLLIPYIFDAIRALENGVATKEDIDTGIRLGLNHPMGPFTLMDFIGLDTCLFIGDAMYDEFKDARYAAPPLLRRMVTAGLLGKKSKQGFYSY